MSTPAATVTGWRALARGPLLGFATIELASGLTIVDIAIFGDGAGKTWIGMPGKPSVDTASGMARRGKDGKIFYHDVITFSDAAIRRKFFDMVLATMRTAYPDLLPAAHAAEGAR